MRYMYVSAISMFLLSFSAARAQNNDTPIRFINQIDDERIIHVYARSPGDRYWGDDLLEGSIRPGSRRLIDVSDGYECRRDVRVITHLGRVADFERINSCDIEHITLRERDFWN